MHRAASAGCRAPICQNPSRNSYRQWSIATATVLFMTALAIDYYHDQRSEFTVVMLPDTQFYSRAYPDRFMDQTRWIAENVVPQKLAFVSHVGDVVHLREGQAENNFNEREWRRADAAIDLLDGDLQVNSDGLIPYAILPGNHDYYVDGGSTKADRFREFFGPLRYAGRRWYGGHSPDETSFYQVFEAGGFSFLHIALEWEPRTAAIDWARGVIAAHPRLPVILATHSYLDPGGRSPIGEVLFQQLVRSTPQIFMVLSGHESGEYHQISRNDWGMDVIEILADYQARPNGGDGWLQLLRFRPGRNRIEVRTFSPSLRRQEIDSDSRFAFKINFKDRFDFSSPRRVKIVGKRDLPAAVASWLSAKLAV